MKLVGMARFDAAISTLRGVEASTAKRNREAPMFCRMLLLCLATCIVAAAWAQPSPPVVVGPRVTESQQNGAGSAPE